MAATIRAVAEAAGVSITTVSFVLNNKRPQVDAIPKDTRERVKSCAAALGYRRNPAAAALRTGRSLWIGVVVQRLKDESDASMWAPYELSLLSGTQSTLSDRGYFTVLGAKPAGGDTDSVDALISAGVGGLILRRPSPEVVEHLASMGEDRIPVIVVFPHDPSDFYPYSIDVDNFQAGRIAADMFVRAGRRAPMYVLNENYRHVEHERARGFAQVIERELGSSPMLCELPAEHSDSVRIAAMTEFIRAHKPDCVMATEAGNSYLITFAAERLDLRIPEDLAIIGFDCYSFRSARDQRVSAVGTSWWEAGQLAASSILDIIENGTKWTEPKTLAPRFIAGDTTPPELPDESGPHWLF